MFDRNQNEDEASWGIHINRHDNMPSQRCPSWARGIDQMNWESMGVIIWDKAVGKVHCLSPHQALDVLDDLKDTSDWKESPFYLGWNSYTVPFSEELRQEWKNNQNRRNDSGGMNSMALMPERTQELFLFLSSHEGEIRALADTHTKEVKKALGRVYALLINAGRKHLE